MATKVNIKGVEGVELSVRDKFLKISKNKQMLNEIGETAVKRMQFQARVKKPLQGKRPDPGSFPVNYPKDSTVRRRRSIAKRNKTHPTYKDDRPNLTITGQLIDGLMYKIRNNALLFFVGGRRRAYKNKDGSREVTPSNEQIYRDLLAMNAKFAFIGVDDKLSKRINNIVRRTLRRALKV